MEGWQESSFLILLEKIICGNNTRRKEIDLILTTKYNCFGCFMGYGA